MTANKEKGCERGPQDEGIWHVVEYLWLGAGYFAKIPVSKALSELPKYRGLGNFGPLA
jgi:hypothetical protein